MGSRPFILSIDPIINKDIHDYQYSDSIFYPTSFTNLKAGSKRSLKANVLLDRKHPYIFTTPNSTGSARILQGMIHPDTGLLVLNNSKRGDATMLMQDLMLKQIRADFNAEVNNWSDTQALDMKSPALLDYEFTQLMRRWANFSKDLNSQIAQLPTNVAMDYNSHVIYQGETITHDIDNLSKSLITQRMPFENPIHHQKMDTKNAEEFLDTFLDSTNKEIFSWYLGAALLNKDIDDETISKALVILSPGGGRGKTTLVDLMTDNLFPEDFVDHHGSFDTIFDQFNKFGTSVIKNRRLVCFNEATWGIPGKDGIHNHDFTGLNETAMKTVWGDGVVDAEAKFQDLEHRDAKGLHIICSNYAPIIKTETNIHIEGHNPVGALARRILPCMLKATSMSEKGRYLGMTRDQMHKFVKQHALEFAVYFTRTYLEDPYKFANYAYDQEYLSDMQEDQEIQMKIQEDLAVTFTEKSKQSFCLGLRELDAIIDVRRFFLDIISKDQNIRIVEDEEHQETVLYINSSSTYLSRFGSEKLRHLLHRIYPIQKRFGMRVFRIPLTKEDLKTISHYQERWDVEKEEHKQQLETDQEAKNPYLDTALNYEENRYAKSRYSKEYYDRHLKQSLDVIFGQGLSQDNKRQTLADRLNKH